MTATQAPEAVESLAGTYDLDPVHSRLGFAVRHMVTLVHGHFASFTGHLRLAGPGLENSTGELAIDPASIDTSNPDRNAHLRSADFFDTGRFPEMRFRSSSVRRESTDSFTVTGELTMKGTARPVELHLTLLGSAVDPYGQFRLGFTGTGTISRRDWGLTWNVALETGGFVLADTITLELDGAAVRVP